MAQDIDLMPPEASKKEKTAGSVNRTVNVTAIVSLLVVAAILLGLFGYQLFLASSAVRIDSQTKDAEEQILDQASKEITHRALVSKLDDTANFLNSRLLFAESYKIVLDVLKKSGAVVTGGELNNDGTFTIIGDAKSTKVFRSLVNAFNDEKFTEDLENIKLVSLTKIPEEPYKFMIEYKVLKRGLFVRPAEKEEPNN